MSKITIQDLSVTYVNQKKEHVQVLKNLNAEFSSGRFHVIMGYSGCGKTTLLHAIAGMLNYEGLIQVNGCDISQLAMEKRNIALVSQEYVLYPKMTIFDNIAFPLKVMGAPKQEIRERVNEVAELLELTHCLSRRPKHLSGGQQQRVAIARALVRKPEICLFDEPFSNLDISLREKARNIIKLWVKESGCTALYVTHDFAEGMVLADNLVIVNDGKVEISGTPSEVYHSGNEVALKLLNLKGGSVGSFI